MSGEKNNLVDELALMLALTNMDIKGLIGPVYPMCKAQPVQLDCRDESCKFHQNGRCCNISPAITINPNGTVTCWTKDTDYGDET